MVDPLPVPETQLPPNQLPRPADVSVAVTLAPLPVALPRPRIDLAPIIEAAATKPKQASNDNGSMTAHSLPELIEAAKFLKGTETVTGTNPNGGPKSAWHALRPARASLPGCR